VVFLDVGLLALVLGKLLGGTLTNLGTTRVRGKELAFAAIGLQLVAFPSDLLPWSTPTSVAKVLWLGSYTLLGAMVVLNRRIDGVPVVAAGLVCNLVAIVANGGLMPVRPGALAASGGHYAVHNNSIQLGHPHVALLVDRWAAPAWVPFANVFSVGDVLIALGIAAAVVSCMRGGSRRMRLLARELPGG